MKKTFFHIDFTKFRKYLIYNESYIRDVIGSLVEDMIP